MFGIDLTTVTAISSWALATGTLLILWWQTRQERKINSANAVMELRERFDSPRMRRARKHLSTRLLHAQHEDITSVEVATFFELVGTLTRRRLLDPDLVWEAFGNWVTAYWSAMRRPVDLIARTRTELKDPLVFHEFEWLTSRIAVLDRQRLGNPVGDLPAAPEDGLRMLKRETELDLDVS